MISLSKKLFSKLSALSNGNSAILEKKIDSFNLNLGRFLGEVNSNKHVVQSFCDVEFSIFSQWGEDGILDWIISKIPDIDRRFIEFGVQDFQESNTRFLLLNRNWSGLVFDGCRRNIDSLKKQGMAWRYDLRARAEFLTCENINEAIQSEGFSGNIGVLSIDIDGNDYWIWDAISVISPSVVIVEYNAVFGDRLELTVPYDKAFNRNVAHFSRLYFGASIKALITLGERKGYCFLGTGSAGVNAFFVKKSVSGRFSRSLNSRLCFPSKFRESRDESGSLSFVSGSERLDVIGDCVVLNLETSREIPLSKCGTLYSEKWASGLSSDIESAWPLDG